MMPSASSKPVEPAARVTADGAYRRSGEQGKQYGADADGSTHTGARHDSGQDVPAEFVGAEPVMQRWRCITRMNIHVEGTVGRIDKIDHRDEQQEADEHRS